MSTHKICAGCNTQKPRKDFYKSNQTPDGLYASCRECHKATVTAYVKAHPKQHLAYCRTYQKRVWANLSEAERDAKRAEHTKKVVRKYWDIKKNDPVRYALRLKRQRERVRKKKLSWTPEQRAAANAYQREKHLKWWNGLTENERNVYRRRAAQKARDRVAAMSPKQLKAYRKYHKNYQKNLKK